MTPQEMVALARQLLEALNKVADADHESILWWDKDDPDTFGGQLFRGLEWFVESYEVDESEAKKS